MAAATCNAKLVRRPAASAAEPAGWWITGTPEGVDEMGPFATRAEAQESRRRLAAFLANCDKRGFITSGR